MKVSFFFLHKYELNALSLLKALLLLQVSQARFDFNVKVPIRRDTKVTMLYSGKVVILCVHIFCN